MKKFGLIGHPIAHSLSPALFKAAYEGRYPYDLIEEEDFEKAYRRFLDEYDAVNVTAPFKESAFAKADIITDDCRSVGATNLLVKTAEGVIAYNSDFLGVRKWLMETSKKIRHNDKVKVLVVGYGGAGKAATAAAESLGTDVTILNRTIKSDKMKSLDGFCSEFRQADIMIYNIPAPIKELDMLSEEDCRGGEHQLQKFILEANYKNPSFTPELIKNIHKSNPYIELTDGKIWLLYQAVTGYEIFTGETPDLKKMREVI